MEKNIGLAISNAAKNVVTVWKEFPRSFSEIGMIVPSGEALSRCMSSPVESQKPQSILEVGCGTGPMTRQILKLMKESDTLILCEKSDGLRSQLTDALKDNPHYQKHKDRIEIFNGDLQALYKRDKNKKFDVIVSSLPFLSLPAELVEEVYEIYNQFLSDGGVMTCCEYIGFRPLLKLYNIRSKDASRIHQVEEILKKWRGEVKNTGGKVDTKIRVLNVPPAYSIHLKWPESKENS